MIHSLRTRLLLTMIIVAGVTAGTVALLARQTTVSEFQRYITLSDERNRRLADLFSQAAALRDAPADERAAAIERLADDVGERVIITDELGLVIADSAGLLAGRSISAIDINDAVVVQYAPDRATVGAYSGALSPTDQLATPPGAQGAFSLSNDIIYINAAGPTPVPGEQVEIDRTLPGATAPDPLRLAMAPVMVTWSGVAPPDPIQAGFISGVNRSLGLALVAAAATAALLTALVSRRILGPIEALTAAARRMERGDLGQQVAVRSRDEIAELAQAFNAMAAGLRRLEDLRRHMVTDVAHELRTPLTNIRGYLEALRDGVAAPDAAMIESLHEEALLLNRLVDDLQDLALAEAGQLTLRRRPTDLATVAGQVAGAARPRLEAKGVGWALELPPDLPQADADPERVGQVLRNLLNNALSHTPAGGEITIAATAADGELTIMVRDTGSGIAPADLPNIFERFYRADRARARATGGAGLGLTIVRQLVEAHGGRVWAESAPGAGTTVSFTLPAA